jgi:MSHA biogenesis protein MshK
MLALAARAADLSDPTRPEIAAASPAAPAAASRFELRAVLIGKGRRVAVINGRALGVGDTVDGAEVLSIDAGRVRIRTPDGERELALADAVNVTPAGEGNR